MSEDNTTQPLSEVQVISRAEAAMGEFKSMVHHNLSAIGEHSIDDVCAEILAVQSPELTTLLPEQAKTLLKQYDETRKAAKKWKVEIRKEGERLEAVPKLAYEYVKDQTKSRETQLLAAEKHMERLCNALENHIQVEQNRINEKMCQDFVQFGFELNAGTRMLRYAGNKMVAIDSLFKLGQDQINQMCDEHEAWLVEHEKEQAEKAAKAKAIKDMTLRLFKAEVLPTIHESQHDIALKVYEGALAGFSDNEAIQNPSFGEAVYSAFDREFVPIIPEPLAQYPATPDQSEPAGSQVSSQRIDDVNDSSAPGPIQYLETTTEGQTTILHDGAESKEPSQFEKDFQEYRTKKIALALDSRVKPGLLGNDIVFDSGEMETLCRAFDNLHGNGQQTQLMITHGGVLFCNNVQKELVEALVTRWNAVAPARKAKTSRGV